NEGDTVEMGEVVAKIDTDAKKPAAAGKEAKAAANANGVDKQAEKAQTPAQKASTPDAKVAGHLSPAVGRIVKEHKLDPTEIQATGKGGRLTKGDVIEHIDRGPAVNQPKAVAPLQAKGRAPSLPKPAVAGERAERREPMSMMRRRIAERLVNAQQTAAILTTFNEIDLHNFIQLRNQYKDSFKERHGVGLGFMSIFVKAAIEALKSFPAINGWIDGNEIVYHDYYDIGVAVSSERGLVV